MVKIDAYFLAPADIPIVAKLTGLSEDELREKYEAASAKRRLCVFKAEVTEEQYQKIQQWKNEPVTAEQYQKIQQLKNEH